MANEPNSTHNPLNTWKENGCIIFSFHLVLVNINNFHGWTFILSTSFLILNLVFCHKWGQINWFFFYGYLKYIIVNKPIHEFKVGPQLTRFLCIGPINLFIYFSCLFIFLPILTITIFLIYKFNLYN